MENNETEPLPTGPVEGSDLKPSLIMKAWVQSVKDSDEFTWCEGWAELEVFAGFYRPVPRPAFIWEI